MRRSMLSLVIATAAILPGAAQAITFVNALAIANGPDLSGLSGASQNRLGGFGSDLAYDAGTGTYYGITDRGPGGGVLSYAPRAQAFTLSTDATTGAISNFQLKQTIIFRRPDSTPFDGLNPTKLNGSPAILGNSLDSEGMARLANGHFLISDEYGPSIYEFDAGGVYLRSFTTPANIVPKQADGTPNYTDGRPTVASGRQDNRGFEGLTVTPDGKTAYAVLQDPLVDEGTPDGRRSRNVRIVEFDVASGIATRQLIYQLDPLAALNGSASPTFDQNSQGRSIGVSAIQSLGDGKFLVLERDNRGLGTETSATDVPVSKRVYQIDITGASDATGQKLTANALPAGFKAVTKSATPYIDLVAALRAMGLAVPEKVEGIAFGEQLADGGRTLLLITDNDFSVSQNGGTTQFDVCFGNGGSTQVAIGAGCPTGTDLLPTYLYSFRLSANEYAALTGMPASNVPEPATWTMAVMGFGLLGGAMRCRRAPYRVRFAG